VLPGALALDARLSRAPAHDEVGFVIAHQTHELWLEQFSCELAVLVTDLDADCLPAARRTLERAERIVAVLIEQLRALDALPLAELRGLDSLLGRDSGLGSDPLCRLGQLAGNGAATLQRWLARERRPDRPRSVSVREAFIRAVARRLPGGGYPDAPSLASPDVPRERHLGRWLASCLSQPPLAAQRELALRLRDLDEQLATWGRQRHALRRRLCLAGSRGPRGSEPALDRRFFPELWT